MPASSRHVVANAHQGDNMPSLTEYLTRWSQGDDAAREAVFSITYNELRRIAAAYLRREGRNHTLQTTDVVNSVCLRLLGGAKINASSRAHFMRIAAQAVRRMLVDHARRRARRKRPPAADRVTSGPQPMVNDLTPEQLLALDECLDRLGTINEQSASVFELRYFGGLTGAETAATLGISPANQGRKYASAKAWLLECFPLSRDGH